MCTPAAAAATAIPRPICNVNHVLDVIELKSQLVYLRGGRPFVHPVLVVVVAPILSRYLDSNPILKPEKEAFRSAARRHRRRSWNGIWFGRLRSRLYRFRLEAATGDTCKFRTRR